MKRWRTEIEPARGPSEGVMPVEETTTPTSSSEGKMMQILVKLMDESSEMRKLLENHIESNSNQNIMFGKYLEKLTQSLEKLSAGQSDLQKQLELHTKAPRSQCNQEQQPRYRLVFKSNMDENIDKGKSIEIHVALVDFNSAKTVKDGPLASATVELVVIDAKFNENNNQHNWSTEDFKSNIMKERQGNSATVNVDGSGKSIVSNGRFNLENGYKHHCDFSIFRNSGNKRWRLGVMVVSTTQERVLEGLSNPFFVRGHDRNRRPVTTPALGGQYQPLFQRNTFVLSTEPATSQQHQVLHRSMVAQVANNRTVQAWVDNGNQEQNGPMSNMQNPSRLNSAYGNRSVLSPVFGGQNQPLFQRNTPVLSTEPATSQQQQVPHWSMLPQASNNLTGLKAIGQIQSQFIENADVASTEPSASQAQQAWIPQNQDHWPNLTQQPMNNGTASVETAALHGDFNVNGQEYWPSSASVETVALHGQEYWPSEEFICSMVRSPPGEVASSVLGGDRILVRAGGEACLRGACFQTTSFCARTGMFKMGTMMASSQKQRIQEEISEPFWVIDRHAEELSGIDGVRTHKAPAPGFRFLPGDKEQIVHYVRRRDAAKPLPVQAIAEAFYKFNPWDLPAKAASMAASWYRATSATLEMYRSAGSGYWNRKATEQKEMAIPLSAGDDKMLGFKKTPSSFTPDTHPKAMRPVVSWTSTTSPLQAGGYTDTSIDSIVYGCSRA